MRSVPRIFGKCQPFSFSAQIPDVADPVVTGEEMDAFAQMIPYVPFSEGVPRFGQAVGGDESGFAAELPCG